MPKLDAFKRTRFFQLCMAHPYALASGCGLFVLGAATGVSTCAILARSGVIADCSMRAAQATHLLGGLSRIALFNLMLCCGVLSSAFRPSFLPLSCLCLALKGFALGFAIKQLQLEYAWWGVVYGLLGILLPSFCMLTGMIFCFGYGTAQLRTLRKPETGREKDGVHALQLCARLTIFLTILAILLEGVAAQVLLRVLLA